MVYMFQHYSKSTLGSIKKQRAGFTSADLHSEHVGDEAFFAGTRTSAICEGARRTEDVTRQRLLGTRVVCCDTRAHA